MIQGLAIEPTNTCNLSCPECYARTSPRPQGFMSWQLFTKLVDEAQKIQVKRLALNYAGEPTLHPKFKEMIDYSSGKGFQIGFATNGTNMTPEISESIVKGAIRSVNFSVHNPINYKKIYNNMVILHRKRGKKTSPLITVSVNYSSQTLQELEAERQYWLTIADNFRIISTIENMRWSRIPPNHKLAPTNSKHCLQPMNYLAVLWDGKATICCRDIGQELAFGDLNKYSLTETWNSKTHMDMINNLTAKQIPKGILCEKCQLWNNMVVQNGVRT